MKHYFYNGIELPVSDEFFQALGGVITDDDKLTTKV